MIRAVDNLLGRSYRFNGITFTVIGYDPTQGFRLSSDGYAASWCSRLEWVVLVGAGLEAA